MHNYERELLRRRREHLILRVDRADLSKNVLRGFTAFDLFLEQHPEFREKVTFIAHLIPSRQDVPEYAEYLEKIEALVAVVNHRHGTTDWMPIDLRLRENLDEAIAAYKHYDLLMVNAMFDGMNLVAKEGPLVNERNGVSLLSENTGAHEELAEFALSVNPFDVQEQADAIHRALTMSAEERSWRAQGLKRIVTATRPGRLGRRPAGRHRGQAQGARARRILRPAPSGARVGCELAAARRREDGSRRWPPGGCGQGVARPAPAGPGGHEPGVPCGEPGAGARGEDAGAHGWRAAAPGATGAGRGKGAGWRGGSGTRLRRGAAAAAARGDQHRGRGDGRQPAHVRPPHPPEQPGSMRWPSPR